MKLSYLFFAALPLWGAANLQIGAYSLSSDGLTLTIPITNCVTSLSPGSGITGFIVGDTQDGSGRAVSSTAQTSSGCTVTISGLKNPITGAPEPLNGPWDDAVSLSLATVGGGSNLTDMSSNTPSATGNTGVAITTNSSTWYAAGGSTFAAASRIQGGHIATDVYPQEAFWASSDGYIEATMTCTAIDVVSFTFNSRYVLIQDGADIHDWGQSAGTTVYQPLGLVSGLSGSHTYRFMQIESTLVPYGEQAIRSIRCVGATLGARPALRTITAECDASITGYSGPIPMTDSRQGHAFLQAGPYAFVDQHVGQAGAQVTGGLETVCPTEMANVGGTPAVLYLWGNINDLAAMVPTMTYQTAFQNMITGIQGNGTPPNKIVTIGSYLVTGYSVTAYNAALATVATNTSTIYADPSLWLTAAAGKQSDNLHLSYGACPDFTLGECVIANRMLPITAGQVLGSSLTFTGPSTGAAGSPSTNFTVMLQGGAQFVLDTDSVGRQTITCADGGSGGVFTPSIGSPGTGTVNITQTTGTNFTFTYNAASSGAKTITCSPAVTSATAGWAAAAPLTYTATGAALTGVQVFITEPFARTLPGEGVGGVADAIGVASSNGGNITNVDLSWDGGSYNGTYGPASLLGGPAPSLQWLAGLDVHALPNGPHTLRARATDALSNVGYSPVISFNVLNASPICTHTQVGPVGTGIFCEKYQENIQVIANNTIAFTGGYTAGQKIFVEATVGTPQIFQTTLNGAINNSTTTVVMVGACSSFPSTPFDYKVNEHPGFTAYGRVEKMTVTACTGVTATVTRGVAGNDCVLPNGELSTCSAAIAHDDGAIVNRWGSQAVTSASISNTNSYTWTTIKQLSSGPFNDLDDVNGSWFMATVPMTTVTTDTITFANAGTDTSYLEGINYSGLGTVDTAILAIANGGPGNPGMTGPFASAPGNLNLAFVGGAPTTALPGENVRGQDTIRPYVMVLDQYSVSNTANMGVHMNSEGFSALAMSIKPANPAPFGRSLVLSSQSAFNNSVPGIASNAACRFEVSMSDWGSPTIVDHPITNNVCDTNTYWVVGGASPTLLITPLHVTGFSDCQIPFAGKNLVKIRWQRIPTTGSTGTLLCQATDETGNTFLNSSSVYTGITGPTTTNGVSIGGTVASTSFAYFRVYSTTVAATATPPTTAQDLSAPSVCTAAAGLVVDWKFDTCNNTGTLVDFNGNMFPAALSSGSPTYVTTPYQGLIKAVPRTGNAPSWSPWISMKVNATNQLDGSTSYSDANLSNLITPTWSNVSGPATPTLVSSGSLVTNVTGVTTRGGYTFNLHAVDTANDVTDTQFIVGAVDYDSKGNVVQTSDETKIFGDQIAFGQNPWGYADERHCTAVNLQINGTDCNGNQIYPTGNAYFSTTTWLTNATGLVTYPFAGIGPAPGQGCAGSHSSGGTQATLVSMITSSATTIAIHHAECLAGLLSLPGTPAWILIGNTFGNVSGVGQQEQVCIASTTATTGDATLTVCYDGRGMAGAIFLNAQPLAPASSWAINTVVGEFPIVGSGTAFYSDPVRALCPGGIPGPVGQVIYYTGAVTGTAGGTVLTGVGTAWTQNVFTGGGCAFVSAGLFNTDCSHNMQVQAYVRINATHASGSPFAFWALVVSVAADNSTITISRPLPTGYDSGNFSYVITSARYLSTEVVQNANTYRLLFQASGCASETSAFAVITHDVTALNLTNPSAVHITYKDTLGAESAVGPNFYGTGLAERNFENRSGFTPAVTAANQIDDNYIRDPELYGPSGSPLLNGGGIIGSIVDKVLNGSSPLNWLDIYPAALEGVSEATKNCNSNDPRDRGYPQGWLSLPALFDLDVTRQATYAAGMTAWVTNDGTCKRNAVDGYATGFVPGNPPNVYTNSWAGASLFNTAGPAMTLVNGSSIAHNTSTVFNAGMCAGQDDGSGTIHVTPGMTTATVMTGSLAAGYRITITDTSVSPPLVITSQYSVSGATATLAITWPGLTAGDYHFMSESSSLSGFMSVIGTSNADWPDVSVATGLVNNQRLQHFWACQYNSPTQITLNRPWDQRAGSTTDNFIFSYVVAGFEVQPFMLNGVKATAMRFASQNSDSTVATAYAAMNGQIGNWTAAYGMDLNSPGTLGMYYNRVSGDCEPPGVPNAMTLFEAIHAFGPQPGCGFTGLATTLGNGTGEFTGRVNTAEGMTGLIAYYEAQCLLGTSQCNAARAFVDKYYGAVYGDCSLTQGGGATFYCDANFVNTANELSNASLYFFKYTGFFFGMGNASRWPAKRQGGAGPSTSLTYSVQGNVSFSGGVH